MALNFISLFAPYLKENEDATRYTLQAMTAYYAAPQHTYAQDYVHCVQLCNLAAWLFKNRDTMLAGELKFAVGDHTTDCYWYEVLWRARALAGRCVNEVVEELKAEEVPAPAQHEHSVLMDLVVKIKNAVGVVSYVSHHIEHHCSWAQEHMHEEWAELKERWDKLRALGYWCTGMVHESQKKYMDASNVFYALYTLIRTKEHSALMDSIHTNAKIQCHVAMGKLCEDRAAFGYAVAHYGAAHQLGHVLTASQQQLKTNNQKVFLDAVPSLHEVEARMAGVIKPLPVPLFVRGEDVIDKVTFVFDGYT